MPVSVDDIVAPAMPIPTKDHSPRSEEIFRDILRLFFNRLVDTVNNGVVRPINIQVETGTARTITASDQNEILSFTSGSAVTVTVPVSTSEDLPIGFTVRLDQDGAGQVTVVGEVGTTVNAPDGDLSTRVQYAGLHISKTASDVYKVMGVGL